MSKDSDRREVVRMVRKYMGPPFKALLGDGGGTVEVAGKTGYVWARRLGQEEKVFQAYNRSINDPTEGRTVLVQESRIEGLPGYEIMGSMGGDATDLATHFAAEPFDAHLNNPTMTVQRTTNQTIPEATWTSVSWDTRVTDNDTMWASGAPTRITFNTAGTYLLTAWVHWENIGANRRAIRILLNGATVIGRGPDVYPGANVFHAAAISSQWPYNLGDYAELQVYQNSGNPGGLDLMDPWAVLTATRVS